jgi:hypothetical protein
MTSATTTQISRAPCRNVDPFVAPMPSHRIADASLRSRVVLRGVVVDVSACRWAGGPVLEVTLSDGSDVCLAFLGRQRVPGIEPGRVLTAAGTIWSRRGRRVVLNPYYWLHEGAEAADG